MRATGWVTATDQTIWPTWCNHFWCCHCGSENGPINCVAQTYASAEYLLWWYKDSRLPPLVTTGSTTDLFPGALGQPGTGVLIGGSIGHEEQSGGRFRLGHWFDEHQMFGVEANYFFLGRRTAERDIGSDGSLVLARPFVDVTTNTQRADLVAFPGTLAGFVGVSLDTSMWSLEANARSMLWKGSWYRAGLLAGFRFLEMSEGLHILEFSTQVPGGNQAGIVDSIGTRNRFYGGQVGSVVQMGWGRWNIDFTTKIALGTVDETATINGQTVLTTVNGTSSTPVGLLAATTNSGRFSHDEFAFVPEIDLQFNYQLTDHLKAYIGYGIVYSTEVARPGEQVDLGINPSQLPTASGAGTLRGVARPTLSFQSSDFWAQGISFGMEIVY